MTVRTKMWLCTGLLVLFAGCESAPPPVQPPGFPGVTATATNGAAVAFTATVVYSAAGPTWTYTVASATGAPISNIELVTQANLKDCTMTPPVTPGASRDSRGQTWKVLKTPAGTPVGFSDSSGAASITFSVTCNKANGPVYLFVTDTANTATTVTNNAGQNTIGPLAGPV